MPIAPTNPLWKSAAEKPKAKVTRSGTNVSFEVVCRFQVVKEHTMPSDVRPAFDQKNRFVENAVRDTMSLISPEDDGYRATSEDFTMEAVNGALVYTFTYGYHVEGAIDETRYEAAMGWLKKHMDL